MTVILVLGLAIVDSVNPSALVITIYLLSQSVRASSIVAYIAGIFLSYLTMGVVLLAGVDLFDSAISSRNSYLIEGVIGAVMLGYSLLPMKKERASISVSPPSPGNSVALFILGVSVTLLELPTALPYFGAIAILTNADVAIARCLAILVLYNVIFVLPPLLLVAGNVWFGSRTNETYWSLRDRLQDGARETMLWIVGIVGFHLLLDSLLYFIDL